jgi:hypothetical protein
MSVSKRDRAECVEYLLCCADRRIADVYPSLTVSNAPKRIRDVLLDAYDAAAGAMGFDAPMADDYLEAAGLLRDGWSPGEPVEVRR